MRGQRQYKGRSPSEPRPDDSYSYQPSPEPSQYPAFDNTHLRNASPCSFHSSKSLWTKWTRTTLLSSLVMYSMLSRLITLSPTRSNLLMVHLLPPTSAKVGALTLSTLEHDATVSRSSRTSENPSTRSSQNSPSRHLGE